MTCRLCASDCSSLRGIRNHAGRLAAGTALFMTFLFFGCSETSQGPKREDHESAHKARYHPEVKRGPADGVAQIDLSATRPAGVGSGPVGVPVLFVNGDPITVPEIVEPLGRQLAQRADRLDHRAYEAHLARAAADEIRRQVRSLVVFQEAKRKLPEQGHRVLDTKADELINNLINREFDGVRARFENHLEALGLNLETMRELARRDILVSQYLHDRFLPLIRDPSRRELMKYYQNNIDQFTTPAKAEMYLIDVPFADEEGKPLVKPTPADKEAARQRAREQIELARSELQRGEDFETVAKKRSRGIRSALGGNWGEITPGALSGRWTTPAEVLFTLQPGQVSPILEAEEAFFIVRCGNAAPEQCLTFEQAQADIIARIQEERYTRITEQYVRGLLANAAIDERQQQGFFQAVIAACPRPVGGKSDS